VPGAIRLRPRGETNAIPERSTAPVYVDEAPGYSEAVGARVPGAEGLAIPQEAGAEQAIPEAAPPHHSTRQNRNVEGQFEEGFKEPATPERRAKVSGQREVQQQLVEAAPVTRGPLPEAPLDLLTNEYYHGSTQGDVTFEARAPKFNYFGREGIYLTRDPYHAEAY